MIGKALPMVALLLLNVLPLFAEEKAKKTPELSKETFRAFQKLGAQLGYEGSSEMDFGIVPRPEFLPEGKIPIFWFSAIPNDKLPEVEVPFGLRFDRLTDPSLEQLKGTKNLASLDLTTTRVTDTGLEPLAGMKLKSLKVPQKARTDIGLKHYLAAIEVGMEIDLWNWNISDAGVKNLAELKNLTHLNVGFSPVTGTGLRELKILKKLTHLRLDNTPIQDEDIAHLKDLPNLTTLSLSGTKITDAVVKELKTLKKLTYLDLAFTKITEVGIKELKTIPNLKGLNLDGLPIGDTHLKALQELSSLEYLSLEYTEVTEAGITNLAGIKLRFVQLPTDARTEIGLNNLLSILNDPVSLDLGNWRLSDQSVRKIRKLKQLEFLRLESVSLTDECVDDLTELPNLKFLNISGTKISRDGYFEIRRALPNCTILR